MTFEEFTANRRGVPDISVAGRFCEDPPELRDQGYVYPTGLYISQVGSHWPENARLAGNWHLAIGNQELIDYDLAFLERTLWQAFENELLDSPHTD